jgi:NADH-quinone oxidoreductase subunit F
MPDAIDLNLLAPYLEALAPQGRTALLPLLHAAQDIYGYISSEAIDAIGSRLNIPAPDIEGVVIAYELFTGRPVEKTVIRVCNDPVCANAGSGGVMNRLTQEIEAQRAEGEPIGEFKLEYTACLGLCEHAPAIEVKGVRIARADNLSYEDLIEGRIRHPRSIVRSQVSILTANCGKNQVTWLVRYLSAGGYSGLRKAIELGAQKTIEMVKESGLSGRGGGAFPTGKKWEFAAQAPGQVKYIVCNAAEAEPGAFKDRVLLEDDPHRILEGMIIAGFAVGASKGYIVYRGEYVYPTNVMAEAIAEATKAGYLGQNILNSGFNFEVEIRRGAGNYIAGEETALFKVIEGFQPIPTERPPFPTQRGLFKQPTVVNNVETLANIPTILRSGAEAFRKIGTSRSPGTKLFSLSGDIALPGLYEIPFGLSLRELIYQLAGGVRDKQAIKAVLIGGAAGAFIGPDELDIPLTNEHLSAAGISLGSGVITVFDATRDLRKVVLRLGRFFATQSCGRCPACVDGTRRQREMLERLADRRARIDDYANLMSVDWTQPEVSVCSLGQFASQAIQSALKKWPRMFD